MKRKSVSASQLAKLGICETAMRFELRGAAPPRQELQVLATEGTRRHEVRHAALLGAGATRPETSAKSAWGGVLTIVLLLAAAAYYWGF